MVNRKIRTRPDEAIEVVDGLTRLSVDQLKRQVDLGLKINPYSVNDDEMIARLIKIGVAGLITDFPQRFPG